MKIAVIVLSLVAVAAAVPRPTRFHRPGFGTNLGGGEEAKEKEFPFSVILDIAGAWQYCSGAIYDETRVITTASCALIIESYAGEEEAINILAGAHNTDNPSGEEQRRIVIRTTAHEDYNRRNFNNNIAILTLNSPLIFTDRVQPIRLAQSTSVPSGDVVTCGHGVEHPGDWGSFVSVLRKATLKVIGRDECNQAFENVEAPAITKSMVCAIGPKKGICNGDVGDPLIAKDEAGREYLAGLGSFVPPVCGDQPSIFTAIGPLREWLDAKLNA